MNFKLIAIIILILGGLVGLGALTGGDDSTVVSNNSSTGTGSNHSQGTSEKGVTFTEALDFECPACASFHPIVTQIKEEYKDRVVFEAKHFPITGIHPNALAAHRAAEAASYQGKFWELHDILFEQRDLWISTTTDDPVPQLDSFAEQLELDMDKFRADFISSEVNAIVNADRDAMKELGAEGTPSFFLNGTRVLNNEIDTLDEFRSVLNEALGETDEEEPSEETIDSTTQTDQ